MASAECPSRAIANILALSSNHPLKIPQHTLKEDINIEWDQEKDTYFRDPTIDIYG